MGEVLRPDGIATEIADIRRRLRALESVKQTAAPVDPGIAYTIINQTSAIGDGLLIPGNHEVSWATATVLTVSAVDGEGTDCTAILTPLLVANAIITVIVPQGRQWVALKVLWASSGSPQWSVGVTYLTGSTPAIQDGAACRMWIQR